MRVQGDVNKISSELKAKLRQLGPKEIGIYKILEYRKVEDPEPRAGQENPMVYYSRREEFAHDFIFDAAAPDGFGGTGKIVEIGVPANINSKGEVTAWRSYQFDNPRDGRLYLYGSKLEDKEMDEFLQLSNHSKNSVLGEHRNTSSELIYELIDNVKEAKIKNKARSRKKDALVFFDMMQPQDMREFAASMNWNHNLPQEELANLVGDYVEEFPEEFARAMEDTNTKRKATIKYALDENIISFDSSGYKIMWGNGSGMVAQLERKEGKNHIDSFNDWLATAANGEKILAQLKRKTAPKEPVTV